MLLNQLGKQPTSSRLKAQEIINHQDRIAVDGSSPSFGYLITTKEFQALSHHKPISLCYWEKGVEREKKKHFDCCGTMMRHWVLLVLLAGTASSLVHPKMSYLFSSADSDDLASSWLTSDTALDRTETDVIPQSDQRWIKPSPKGKTVPFDCFLTPSRLSTHTVNSINNQRMT